MFNPVFILHSYLMKISYSLFVQLGRAANVERWCNKIPYIIGTRGNILAMQTLASLKLCATLARFYHNITFRGPARIQSEKTRSPRVH